MPDTVLLPGWSPRRRTVEMPAESSLRIMCATEQGPDVRLSTVSTNLRSDLMKSWSSSIVSDVYLAHGWWDAHSRSAWRYKHAAAGMHYKGARAANAHGSASQLAARLNIKHHVQLALLVPANPTPQEHARWLCDAPSNGTIAAWRR